MREITLEEIQKKFESLPEDLKWAIMGAKVDDNIIEIGQKEGLNVEQMGQLSLETNMVMFGFTHPDKFAESVKNNMKLGEEKTKAVVNAVNEKILKGIRDKLLESWNVPKAPVKTEEKTKEIKEEKKEEDKDKQILNSAGIQVINGDDKKLKDDIHSVLSQKLYSPVQTPVVKSEHAPENLIKTPGAPTMPPPAAPSAPKGNTSPTYSKGLDPYREKPE